MELSNFIIADCITSTPKIYVNFPKDQSSPYSNNVIIGHNSHCAISNDYVDCTVIGNNASCTASNQVQLGSSNTNIYSFGGVQNISDARDKAEIKDTELGLDFVNSLRPVDYKWNCRRDYVVPTNEVEFINGVNVYKTVELPNDGSKTRTRYHHGLIAQEVKQVMDTMGVDFGGYQDHTIKGGQEQLSIAYTELIGPMIKAIQELTTKNRDLELRIQALEGRV